MYSVIRIIKAIILDFDGVITESVDIKTEAFRELFSKYTNDVERIVDYHRKNNGVSRFVKFKHIWEEMLGKRYDDAAKKSLGMEFSKMVTDKVISCPFVRGAMDFLEKFYRIVPLYVASAVPREELAVIIDKKKITQYFTKIYGYPPVTKSQAIEDVSRTNLIDTGEILYIGDSTEDLKASKIAGTQFIGRRNKEDFKDYSVPVFNDMDGVSEYILNNLKVENERIRHTE